MSVLLEARAVTKLFGGGMRGQRMTAVDDFSLAIADEPPSITALVGESGSGKTTLARLLLGLIEPSEGAVLYKGADIRTLSGARLSAFRRDVQVIFQDPFEAYNPFYRIDHVLETPVLNFGLAGSRREARRMIEETLRAVGLRPEETLGRYPHQLSGGQRQRIMVARALLIRPRVIIADEPVSMVDASLTSDDPDQSARASRQFRDFADLHHARPDHCVSDQPERHRPLPRPDRRSRRRREGRRRSETSLHPLADRLDPLSRPGSRLEGRRGAVGRRGGRLGPWLPLRATVLLGDGDLPRQRPAVVSHRSAPRGRLLPLSRQRGRGGARHWNRPEPRRRCGSRARASRRRRRSQTCRLSRGLAISSSPIEIKNSAMNRMATTMIGASHHHHQPLITAPVKLTQ